MIDTSPPAPGTIIRPQSSPARVHPASNELAKHKLQGGAAPANARRARVATDALLADPEFDPSLTASRGRLEKALALGSAIALRQAENGLVDSDSVDLLQKMATMYRTLAQTETRPAGELTDEELRRVAG